MPGQNRAEIRPWRPPASLSRSSSPPSSSSSPGAGSRRHSTDEGQLSLEVLDVTSTAVALSVFTPSPSVSTTVPSAANGSPARSSQPAPTPAPSSTGSKPPTISIQLDRRPWPHVAHAGSSSVESLTPGGGGRRGAETTVIVYGLDPGRDYEISLDVVGGEEGGEEQHHQATVDIETGVESARQSEDRDSATPEGDFSAPTPSPHAGPSSTPEGPPPPYSASLPPSPPNESQLRALLKKIRASSKRTESVLNASISALKKNVEKGMKEDQRARTRIVSLEEAIRKAGEGERESRTKEMDACEARIRRLEELEEEVKEELERRREGKAPKAETEAPAPAPEPLAPEEGGEEEDTHEGIADLARELDSLNKLIDEAEKETRRKAKDSLRSLEMELSQIDHEILALDREEAHRYNMAAAHRSSDSLDRVDPARAPPPLPVQATPNSGFNIRWRRNPAVVPPVVPQQQPTQSDPRSFGRFFRRTSTNNVDTGANTVTPAFNAQPVSDRFLAQQQYAQAHQALWAPPNPNLPPISGGLAPRSAYSGSVRSRSGSLNSGPNPVPSAHFYGNSPSAASGSTTSLGRVNSNRVVSMPISIPSPTKEEKSKDKDKDKDKDKESSSVSSAGSTIGASWNKISTWSQVVGRGKKGEDKEAEEKK